MICLCRGRSSATSAARGHSSLVEISVQTNQLLHDVNELDLAPRREKEIVSSGRMDA
jgi:hypothetical protein